MLQQIAKKKIFEWFPEAIDPSKTYNHISEEEYLDVFHSIKKVIPLKKAHQNHSLILFLYAACLKFDRWLSPTPPILSQDFTEKYKVFVKALVKAENGESDNTKVFKLKILKNDIFELFDSIDLEKLSMEKILTFRKQINEISPPTHTSKIDEFHNEYTKITHILDGLENKILRTKILTKIPYPLHTRSIAIKFIWSNIPVSAILNPTFYAHPSKFTVYEPASQPAGPARWQSGTTDIELQFSALINTDKEVPSLLSYPSEDFPFSGWSKEFELLFGIIHDLSWNIRLYHEGEKQWVPAPRDIPEAEVEIYTPTAQRLFWKQKGSPGVLTKVFHPDQTPLNLDLGEIVPPDWHTRCKWIAISYLQLGETNEALFWLNVGIETLFRERFSGFSKELIMPNLEDELESSKVYWDEAENVIAEQCPELAGKTNWPKTTLHVSIFRKLKYFYKIADMQASIKELLSNYSKISKYRNALFHGSTEQRLPVEKVSEAIEGFNWIEQNHNLKSQPPATLGPRKQRGSGEPHVI